MMNHDESINCIYRGKINAFMRNVDLEARL